MYRLIFLLVVTMSVAACGNNLNKSPKKGPDGSSNAGNGASNGAANGETNGETNGPAECGNGVLEPGELCDGDCPTECPSSDACNATMLVGSADACNAQCLSEEITECVAGDSCCPPGCSPDADGDCSAACGNGVVDAGETCDGNCPAGCDDDMACTVDIFTGSASTCTAACSHEPVTACRDGDGCCPDGCSDANDSDCSCVPTTCQAEAECGTIDDGCNMTISCPDLCGADETCDANSCVPAGGSGNVGDSCGRDADCSGYPNAECVQHPDYKDGYCSAGCQFDNDCPAGSHCARLVVGDPDKEKICMENCADDSDCRDDGYGCHNWDSYDDQAQVSDECAPVADGSGEVGDPCDGLWECAPDHECTREFTNQDGTTTTFPGGTCTQPCVPVFGPCGDPDAVCPDMTPICMPECQTSAQCRNGYECIPAQFEMRNYCWPM